MKRLFSLIITTTLILTTLAGNKTRAESPQFPEILSQAAILIEQKSGTVLFEENADTRLHIASITKIMTLILVFDALESGKAKLSDLVNTSAHANSMVGSQIWLDIGEQMSLDNLLKAVVVGSANDAAVALAEHIEGTEESFVKAMNQKAAELGMTNTHFVNATGLDEDNHYSTARDVSVMSAYLLNNHPQVTNYSTIWMDSLRDGKTSLVNTNKLVRFYEGTTGLKTGSTDLAGWCLSASATRSVLSLIAVTLGSKTSDERFNTAYNLLDFGFDNFVIAQTPNPDEILVSVPIENGVKTLLETECNLPETVLVENGTESKLSLKAILPDSISAPVKAGERIGSLEISVGDKLISSHPILARNTVEEMTFVKALYFLWAKLLR